MDGKKQETIYCKQIPFVVEYIYKKKKLILPKYFYRAKSVQKKPTFQHIPHTQKYATCVYQNKNDQKNKN